MTYIENEKGRDIRLEDISKEEEKKILEFLNRSNVEELAKSMEIIEVRDVVLRIAEMIVKERERLQRFTSLKQVMDIQGIGSKILSAIVESTLTKEVEYERSNFKLLMLENPNYFGNLASIFPEFAPVNIIANNTKYEELRCVGYNPSSRMLEAVIHIKQSFGYNTGICGQGSKEYVRFFIDWDNTNNWQDVGMVSFTVYNIIGAKPLEYAVTLMLDADKVPCTIEKLPRVRAILSWNQVPPQNPNYTPVWGNVIDSRIQIDTYPEPKIPHIPVPPNVPYPLPKPDPTSKLSLELLEPKELSITELKSIYKENVQEHRLYNKEIYNIIASNDVVGKLSLAKLQGIDISSLTAIAKIIPQLLYNTEYEELTCVGLDTNDSTLIAVINIKRPFGYLGNLCSKGSYEYVSFWIDWGSGWNYAGTTSVNVHDISSIPAGGLHYAVYLPIDLSTKKVPCEQGAKIAKVRAILSWNIPVFSPYSIPTYGNRMDTHVHIPPGVPVNEGEYIPYITNVGSMNVCDIDQSTGLANGSSSGTANFTAEDSPFGGIVTISGYIANPPHYLSGANNGVKLKYKVSVRQISPIVTQWQAVTDPFNVQITEQFNIPVTSNYTQLPDANGYFEYLEDNPPGPWRNVFGDVLARWNTSGKADGLWEIKVDVLNPVTNQTWSIGSITCIKDGTSRSTVKIRLDNTPPKADLTIDMVANGDYISNQAVTTSPMAICGKMKSGVFIVGRFKAKDAGLNEHFYYYSFTVLPSSIGSNSTPQNFKHIPVGSNYPAVPTTGIPMPNPPPYPTPLPNGIWQLNTNGMLPCGYVVELTVRDRTIVNSSYIGLEAKKQVGFCLE